MGKVIVLALALGMAGCASLPTGGAGGAWCDANSPRRHSAAVISAMSRAEREQAVAHNRRGERECRWQPPKALTSG